MSHVTVLLSLSGTLSFFSKTCCCALPQVLLEALQSLEQYTHVAFTSRNGIQAVLDALAASGCDSSAVKRILNSQSVRCCALGADAELLYQAGVSNVLTPKEVRKSRIKQSKSSPSMRHKPSCSVHMGSAPCNTKQHCSRLFPIHIPAERRRAHRGW